LGGSSPLAARQIAAAGFEGCSGKGSVKSLAGLKAKDLMGIPWMVAKALQADGWYLRADIIWTKPNAMPESVKDRPTKAHEYLFLLSRSDRYYYDAAAIREPATTTRPELLAFGSRPNVGFPGRMQSRRRASKKRGDFDGKTGNEAFRAVVETRNARSVWKVATQCFPGAHFATFPTEIPRRCILAGCPPTGVVLDLFGGSGTASAVAKELGRDFIYIDQSGEFMAMARDRIASVEQPVLFGTIKL
jgi:DNA modification methylase